MVKSKPQNRKTKKQNRKTTQKQNRKTKKKQNRKTTKKQKGGNNDELTMIIRDESLDALKEYVEQGGDINKPGSKGITALMEAIAIQDVPKVQYLIEQGVDVNATADDGKTAYSIAFGNDKLTDLLKNAGANTNPTYLLLLAIEHNNTQSAKAMIDNREALGLNINEQVPQYKTIQTEGEAPYSIYEYPLTLAIKTNNNEIAKHLLEAGASLAIESDKTYDEDTQIKDNKETPIILAVKEQNDMMVDLLLDENMNLNRDVHSRFDINQTSDSNYTALYKAVDKGYSLITDHLLKAGANPNYRNGPNKLFMPIIQAVENYDTDIVDSLIDAGADVNVRTLDHFENTPLILAAYNGDLYTVKSLVEAGADMDIKNNEDTDALFAAYENGYMEVVEYFSDQGHLGATDLLLNMNVQEEHQEPKKKDTKTVVEQIEPKPIEHHQELKRIPKMLKDDNLTFYDVIDMEEKQVKTFLDEDPDNVIFIYKQQIIGTNKKQLENEYTTNRTKIMLECKEPNTYFHQPEENLVKDDENNLLYYLNMDIVGLLGILLPISQLKTLTHDTHIDNNLSLVPPDSPYFEPMTPPGTPPFEPMTPPYPPMTPTDTPPFEPMTPPYPPMTPTDTPPSPEFGEDLSPIRGETGGGNPKPNVFVVDISDDRKKERAITSFGAYDGDNVVSAKHCAETEPMRIGKLYSVDFPIPKKLLILFKRARSKSPKSPKNKTRKSQKQSKTP